MTTATPSYIDYGSQFADVYDEIFPREALTSHDIDWLAQHVPKDQANVLELGVGTGRVAIPLARHLSSRGTTTKYRGIDISPAMLTKLAEGDPHSLISQETGDITSVDYGSDTDTIICVCGTLSMVTSPGLQSQVFRKAYSALNPGGVLIVETHNSDLVNAMHREGTATYAIPYPGTARALVSFSRLEGVRWHLDHCWIADGTATFLSEDSRVTTLAELDSYAVAAGFTPLTHTAGLNGAEIEPFSGTVTAVYRKHP